MIENKDPAHIPALNKGWLTPLYDLLLKWRMREETFKRYLVKNASLMARK